MRKIFSTKYSTQSVSFSLLLLRISCGGLMMIHGYKKLIDFASLSSNFADPLHISSPVSLTLVIFAEFFCAALVLSGLMTRLACIPLIIEMAVALFYIHHGEFSGAGEKATLFLLGYLALLFTGPGKISIDRLIGK